MWSKPCTCCRQFEIDQANKLDTRAKRAARRAAKPQNPPPETIQVVTVPTLTVPTLTVTTYPSLETIISRQMNSYHGYSYIQAPTHDLYGCQLTEGSYNPWSSSRNWEE
jgi:hypothetical protein